MYTDKHRPTGGKGSKWEMYRVILTEVGTISSKIYDAYGCTGLD